MNKLALVLLTALSSSVLQAAELSPADKQGEPLAWVAIPGETWGFAFNITGYEPAQYRSGANSKTGRPYAATKTQHDGIAVSGFIEALSEKKSAAMVRESEWPSSRTKQYATVEPLVIGNVPCMKAVMTRIPVAIEADAKTAGVDPGKNFRHDNLHCYWVKGDWWTEIHASRISADDVTLREFSRIMRSARFTPGSDRERLGTFLSAHADFLAGNYSGASTVYENLWRQERQSRTMNRDVMRVMLDELGMSYGIAGDLKRARSHFQQQIAADPEYAMYYYNLACAEAESGNLSGTVTNLRAAYRRKSLLDPLEALPDPRQDSSFKRYLNAPDFQELMREIKLDH